MREKAGWALALWLLGSAVGARIWAPQGVAALQQAVFGCEQRAVAAAVAVIAAGGNPDEAAACVWAAR